MDLNALDRALEELSAIDPKMQLVTARVLLQVALRGSTGQKEIEKSLKITNASASRNVAYWTDLRADKEEGVGMVNQIEDKTDRRTNILVLSNKGQKFIMKLRNI